MALQEELELQGNWLFRYRSILPITILSIGVLVYIYTIHAPGTLFNKIEFYWHHYESRNFYPGVHGRTHSRRHFGQKHPKPSSR